jgi:hypothetical protein
MEQVNILRVQNAELLAVEANGTYSYYCAIKTEIVVDKRRKSLYHAIPISLFSAEQFPSAFQEVRPQSLMLLTCNFGPHSAIRRYRKPIKRFVLHRASLNSGIMQGDVTKDKEDKNNLNISSSPTTINNLKQCGCYVYHPL